MPNRAQLVRQNAAEDPVEALRAVRDAASDLQHREDIGADGVLDSIERFIGDFLDAAA